MFLCIHATGSGLLFSHVFAQCRFEVLRGHALGQAQHRACPVTDTAVDGVI